jgi:hypothetical protein
MLNDELSPAGDETRLDARVSDRPMCLETSRESAVKQGRGNFRLKISDLRLELTAQHKPALSIHSILNLKSGSALI